MARFLHAAAAADGSTVSVSMGATRWRRTGGQTSARQA